MNNKNRKLQRQRRVRNKLRTVSDMPRLSVYRSNTHIYAQIINDLDHSTLLGVGEEKNLKGTKIERAFALGEKIAGLAKEKKITKVVFDKGSYAYHGRVKSLAEGARKGGLNF